MVAVQILTRNNSKTIKKSLDSILWADRILVADLGSEDDTVDLCEAAGAEIFRFEANHPKNEVRNKLVKQTNDVTLLLEPWEVLVQGKDTVVQASQSLYAMIVNQKSLTKEVRVWVDHPKFINPVYETLDIAGHESNIMIYSAGRPNTGELLKEIQNWKESSPTAIAPYYYEACTLLALGRWREFIPISEHYMFLDKTQSVSSTMNHYYYAMVQLMHVKKVKPTLQNLAICLACNPLMAEFWCLAGDVHYHLTKKLSVAKDLYENAILLGNKRLKNDHWPMDITKYKTYPEKMIHSCNQIMADKSIYLPNSL